MGSATFDMQELPPLWILRHGETVWNVEGRLQGGLDSALTELGLRQARAQADILLKAGVPQDVRVVSSPSGRARRTAEIVAEALARSVALDADLREIGLGAWQGRLISEVLAEPEAAGLAGSDPHLWKFRGPGCERLEEMLARVTRFLRALEHPSIVVTHGVTSRLMRCVALGLAPERLSELPGGQGVVHYLARGEARVLGT